MTWKYNETGVKYDNAGYKYNFFDGVAAAVAEFIMSFRRRRR